MKDLIDREQAVKIIDEIDTFCAGWRDYAISRIKSLPSAEKTATWEPITKLRDSVQCSSCKKYKTWAFNTYEINYCPHCGARME